MESARPMDVRLAKALSHPLRQRLLVALSDRVASPSDLAQELGARLGDVSYHTRQLHLHGCLDLVRTERRRGAIKHFYTASIRLEVEDDEWRGVPAAQRGRIVDELVGDLWREVARAGREDRLSEEDVHISRTSLLLDDQGRKELGEVLRGVVDRAQALQAESADRGAEGARGAELGILLFGAAGSDPVRSSP
ncbi:MAG TPA: hypothetical protein VF533_13790 [Solirubrobacteraceae bacterium]